MPISELPKAGLPLRKRGRPRGPTKPIAKPLTFAAVAHQYARDVISGIIPACLYVRQAAQRHLDHLARESKASFAWRFDDKKSNFACRFLQQLPHVKGEWARPRPGHSTLLVLEPWQVFLTCVIFGWVDKQTSLRKYSELYAEIPRKNAKSTWAAGIGLLMLSADYEYGAEVYCGATTERQAMEVFRTALQMVKRSPEFERFFGVEHAVKSIFKEDDGSRFVPLVGNPGDGSSPSCSILDEVHEHSTWALIDTMRTGMGARSQPLMILITTAGTNLAGPCYAIRSDAIKVLSGTITNEASFGIIYTIDADDDWKDHRSLQKANPNYGVSVKPEFLQKELHRAIQSAHLQNIFKTKHLNVWCGAASGWMNMEGWASCKDESLRLKDFLSQPCWEGDDLAAKIDLASRIKLFKRVVQGKTHYYCFGHHYVPKAVAFDGEHNHYAQWVHSGNLIAHEGVEIQLEMIQQDIEADLRTHNHQCIAFDPFGAQQMQQILTKVTKPDVVCDVPQRWQFLSEPMHEIEAAVKAGRFHHDGDPVLTWAISNVVVTPDKNGNIFPFKERPENKIDPASALFNAMNRAMLAPGPPVFAYATRGLRDL
jgi:phage terminase large subunit-like protein